MANILCKGGVQRDQLAIAISFSSALLMSIEALHPGHCSWINLDPGQYYALSATLATVSTFLGSYILARLINN
ncbi:MAG: hypothetical protein WAO98_06015 [Alphaproteobacteria bacterium]